MGVKFRTFGGGGDVTQVTDAFGQASGPLGGPASAGVPGSPAWAQGTIFDTPTANPNYQVNHTILAAPDTFQSMGIGSAGTGVAAHLSWGFAVPVALMNNSVWGKTQFIQATLVGDTTAGSAAFGLDVMFHPSAMPIGYNFIVNRGLASCGVSRMAPNGNGSPGSSLNSAGIIGGLAIPAIGTVLRVSVDMTTPSAPVIVVKYNGAVQGTFTDNVAPLAGGVPSFLSQMGGGTYFFRNFSAGLGL